MYSIYAYPVYTYFRSALYNLRSSMSFDKAASPGKHLLKMRP